MSGAEREEAEDPEQVEEDMLIGENGELREQMKWMNDQITKIINRELKEEQPLPMLERAKSRGGKQSLPNIGSLKGNGQGSPIATARHKFLTKKATMPNSNLPVRMNSVLKQIKPKLLEHYYNTEDPQSQVLVLQQQIDTLNKREEVYR